MIEHDGDSYIEQLAHEARRPVQMAGEARARLLDAVRVAPPPRMSPLRWLGPARLFTARLNLGNDSLGLLWIPKNTQPYWYQWYGDRSWFPEYHWHGLNLITGNAFILAGLGMFAVLLAISLLLPAARKDHHDEPGRDPAGQRGDLRLPAA